ncbi:MAG TPA: serine/threonine-protein kinase [Kofleriaceae bacterium]|jgi:serine/threonine protein kinase|nr:serine/threonine-protein kinase [Kofleriaceae bacterium]
MSVSDHAIAGRYRVLDHLGHGGTADVFLAEDLAVPRRVALKRSRIDDSGRALCMLVREARIVTRLDHAGIVRLHDRVLEGGRCHLVLQHVDGPSLAAARPAAGWAPEAVAQIGAGLCGALAHIHAHQVVHLDLKAENVVLGPDRAPILIDFGIAACAGEPDVADDPEILIGTPRAMAPEQIHGEAVDGRADLFALGVLLYELATGDSPFVAGSVLETLRNVLDHVPAPVATRAPALPRRLADVIDHLLEKDPALRPQTAAEVQAYLAAAA